MSRRPDSRSDGIVAAALFAALTLAGCASRRRKRRMLIRLERAQGSDENIASLTAVIQANPRDPEGYNVRGSAYGRAGQFKQGARRLQHARCELNPQFFQAYANRALVLAQHGQAGCSGSG
jgi:tetratricopeptide (TPR) repeat protein